MFGVALTSLITTTGPARADTPSLYSQENGRQVWDQDSDPDPDQDYDSLDSSAAATPTPTMNDAETVTVKLAELLRHPEDLDKIPALKAEFTRKKAAVDGQLRSGISEQMEVTHLGMHNIAEGQRTVQQIKEEMQRIDKLCAEAQNMIRDFPHINKVAQVHRNFDSVRKMKREVDGFGRRLDELEDLLRQDDAMPESQPNLLAIHYGLTQLRDIRDTAMLQIKNSEEASTELVENLTLEGGATLQDHFNRLDEVVDWFDEHLGSACLNLIELVQSGNHGLVVKLALVIEVEEKNDKKIRALQDAQREFKEIAARFKSINSGPKETRGYKEKFLKAIEFHAQAQIDQTNQLFLEDPTKLEKSVRWYFNELNTVKLGMVSLMPKKWKIFKTYISIYHRLMHDWLVARIEDENLTPIQMLAIIQWEEKYYAKMQKLGVPTEDLEPHLLDNRGPELVREYRQLIIRTVDEWMDRMAVNDRRDFQERSEDAFSTDQHGIFRTKTLSDMWIMLREQLAVAAGSERPDVVEGVAEAMFRALTSRQQMWESLVDTELDRYSQPTADVEGLQALQDWLVAIANDQIACIDDGDGGDQEESLSYLSRFSQELLPLVSPAYAATAQQAVESLRDGYVDLGTHCISVFASLIFAVDFKSILPEFFTAGWYAQKRMAQMASTFQDYLADYHPVLHPSLRDIIVEELADELLVRYLSSVRNKGVKFRRTDPFVEKIKDDVLTAFAFFEAFPPFPDIKNKWRVVDGFVKLLESDKAAVPDVYEAFKREYWDVQMGWVEAVLRTRDDFERSLLNAVKARAAEMTVERGPETIMTKVK